MGGVTCENNYPKKGNDSYFTIEIHDITIHLSQARFLIWEKYIALPHVVYVAYKSHIFLEFVLPKYINRMTQIYNSMAWI